MKDYAVAYVGDDALPEDVDWAFIMQGDLLVFAIKRYSVTPAALAEAWGTFRTMEFPSSA